MKRLIFLLIFCFAWCEVISANDDTVFNESYNPYSQYFEAQKMKFFDPHKRLNRKIFDANYKIDYRLIDQAMDIYQSDNPKWSKTIFSNVARNLHEPVNMINYVLQGNIHGFVRSFWRFIFNSTLGMGGCFDIAESLDLEYQNNGFDRTMAFYGLRPGNYLVLPWYGSFSYRSLMATFMDFLFNPLLYLIPLKLVKFYWVCYSFFVKNNSLITGAHLNSGSIDPYESWKSIFAQSQNYEFYR